MLTTESLPTDNTILKCLFSYHKETFIQLYHTTYSFDAGRHYVYTCMCNILYWYEKLNTTSPVAEEYTTHMVKGRQYSVYIVYLHVLSVCLDHGDELQRRTG